MSKELVISASRHETKVAILEDDQLVEVHFQRANEYSLAGSIHKGRVTRVLPGMQSAFVDLGLDRDTFLYVSDFFEENGDDIDRVPDDRPVRVERADRPERQERIAPPPPTPPAPPPIEVAAPPPVEAPPPPPPSAPPAPMSHAVTPAHDKQHDDGREDRRGRRSRRRRNRGRGFPESKYAPASDSREEAAPVEPEEEHRSASSFAVLPGESLAKYRGGAEPAAATAHEEDELEAPPETAEDAAQIEPDMPEPTDEGVEPEVEGVEGAVEQEVEPSAPVADPTNLTTVTVEEHVEVLAAVDTADEQAASELETEADTDNGVEDDLPPDVATIANDNPEEQPPANAIPDAPLHPGAGESESESLELGDEPVMPEEASAAGFDASSAELDEIEAETEEEEAVSHGSRSRIEDEEDREIQALILDGEVPDLDDSSPEAPMTANVRDSGSRYMNRNSRRMRRRTRGGMPPSETGSAPPAPPQRSEHRPEHRAEHRPAARPDKTPLPSITDLLKEGQEILVQIAKEPLGQKGARITSHIALPGRYVVYMPTLDHMGVSRKIASDEERQRLKKLLQKHRAGIQGGYIIRTAGEGRTEDEIASDMTFLANLWLDIRQKAEKRPAPALLHHDLDIVQRILRDQVGVVAAARLHHVRRHLVVPRSAEDRVGDHDANAPRQPRPDRLEIVAGLTRARRARGIVLALRPLQHHQHAARSLPVSQRGHARRPHAL